MSCSWKRGSPEKGQLWMNGSYCCLARSAHAHFLQPGFLAMSSLAGKVSTPLLDVTVAIRFRLTVCARNSPKAASLSSWLSACHTACGAVNSAKSGASVQFLWQYIFRGLSPFFRHVFRPTFAIFGVTERTHIRSPAILNVYFTDCYCDCLLLYRGNHIILRYIAHITAANQADGQLLILFEKHIGPYVQHMHSTSAFSQNRILLDLHTKKQRR